MSNFSFNAADTVNLQINQGDTFRMPLRIRDLRGQLIVFTGDELRLTVLNRLEQTVLTLTPGLGIQLSELDSLLTLFVGPEQTAKLRKGDYTYTLKRKQYNTEEHTLVKGKFNVL